MIVTLSRLWLLAIVSFVLQGCALTPSAPLSTVQITPEVKVTLPSPSELGQHISATQLITATWQAEQGQQTQQLPVQLQVDANKVVLAGFSSWGTRLLSLTYQDGEIETQVLSGLENTLPQPEQVLFNLMITLWPQQAWEAPLNQVKWQLIDSTNQRTIIDNNGKETLQIEYENGRGFDGTVHFYSVQNHYSITIETLNYQITQP
ncbi:hypothetical protein BOO91_07135 [Vibrio navarrensis]|uniref:DUF3261 domain-containing protein n=1 Tax=Vibrio navarrensis TaxID=29495 RepID=A0AAJ4IE14_9VIBR|nr:lipoprotein [Vibrio sp. S234-5]MBE3660711.1 hypothetical protein [Vibrio navarrensis]MBE4603691.1 hypothetical protein [Vibrio navarrensis]QPL55095.1 DUF3261 domain-containing protein [Vibrio navarrensis]